MSPKVSVIVPVYNNEVFVVSCIKSLLAQTLQDIEVIAINDGSTDNSSEILHQFANSDSRLIVVDKENGGYGVGINTGLDMARGEYVTILESDDFADLDMLETLVNYADAFNLEVVRANFYLYWAKKIKNDHLLELFGNHECDRVIDPSVRDNQHCFYVQPALWSAIYRTNFIRKNNLRLLETPGAAYQDTAFNFKIWACAKRVMFVHKPFVHYRQDNEASSINNPGKVNTICLEYEEIRRWLREDRPDLHDSLSPVATKMMCDAYTWNAGRVADEYRLEFVKRFGSEFAEAKAAGEVDPALFAPGQLSAVETTISNPQAFIDFITKGVDYQHGIKRFERKVKTVFQVAQQSGLDQAKTLIQSKLTRGDSMSKLVDSIDNEMASRKPAKFIQERIVPQISVVLPVYNTADVLRETLDSIFAQDFTAFEVICVNDGSTDGSRDILTEYEGFDSRLRVIDQDNQGVAAARNRALKEVSAPYTLILDSDDIFAYDMFGKLYKRAQKTKADIVACSSCEFNGETYDCIPTPWALKLDKLPNKDLFTVEDASQWLFEAFMGWPWDRLYKTSLIKNSQLEFPTDLDNSEDGVFVYGLLYRASSLSVVKDVLIKHRSTRKGSVSNSRDKSPECFYEAICRIKRDLKEINKYELLERSFLNWALDYSIWNISTLTDKTTRSLLAKKLTNGGYPELEIFDHSWKYFNLYGCNSFKGFVKLKTMQ
mgnify:FL=1